MADLMELLKAYAAKQNPYGAFGAGASPTTAPAINPAPPVAGPAAPMPVVPPLAAGGLTAAALNPMGTAQEALRTPEGAVSLLGTALDPVGTIKGGGANIGELKAGMEKAAIAEKTRQAAANDERLKAAGLAMEDAGPAPAGPQMGGSAPVVIPGGWQSTISPDARAAFDNAFAAKGEAMKVTPEERDAIKKQEIAAREANNQMAQAALDAGGEELGRQAAAAVQADNSRQAADRTKKDVDAVNAAIDSSAEDPNRWWKSRDTSQTIALGLGAALGAFGEAFAGVKNRTFDMIDAAISRDISAQRADLAKKTGQRDSLLGRLREYTGDAQRAEQLALYAGREATKRMLEAKMLASQDPKIKAQGEQALLELDKRNEALKADLMMGYADNLARTQAYVAPKVVGGPAGSADKDNPLVFKGPDGTPYVAKNQKVRDELAAKSAAINEISGLAEQINKIRESGWTYVPGTEEAAKADMLGTRFTLALKKGEDLGAITKADLDTIGGVKADPTSLFSRAGTKATGYAQGLRQSFLQRLQAEDVEQVQKGYKRDATGGIKPTAAFTGNSPTKTDMPAFKPVGK